MSVRICESVRAHSVGFGGRRYPVPTNSKSEVSSVSFGYGFEAEEEEEEEEVSMLIIVSSGPPELQAKTGRPEIIPSRGPIPKCSFVGV